jgi:hypothetical protein
MWAENASRLLSRSPSHFARMPDQTQASFWDRAGDSRLPPRGAALPIEGSGINKGQRAQACRRAAPWRRELLIEDITDLLGRALIYALATLGLLNALGLVAVA